MQRLETTRNVSKAPIFKSLSHIAPSSSQLCKKSCASMSQVVAVKIVLQTNQSIDNAPVALRMIFGVVNQLQFFNDSDVRCSKKLSPPMAMSCSFWTFPDIFTQLFANSRITVAILKLSQFCHFCSLSKCVTMPRDHRLLIAQEAAACMADPARCVIFIPIISISICFPVQCACSSKRAQAVVQSILDSANPDTLLQDIDWKNELKSFSPLEVQTCDIHISCSDFLHNSYYSAKKCIHIRAHVVSGLL